MRRKDRSPAAMFLLGVKAPNGPRRHPRHRLRVGRTGRGSAADGPGAQPGPAGRVLSHRARRRAVALQHRRAGDGVGAARQGGGGDDHLPPTARGADADGLAAVRRACSVRGRLVGVDRRRGAPRAGGCGRPAGVGRQHGSGGPVVGEVPPHVRQPGQRTRPPGDHRPRPGDDAQVHALRRGRRRTTRWSGRHRAAGQDTPAVPARLARQPDVHGVVPGLPVRRGATDPRPGPAAGRSAPPQLPAQLPAEADPVQARHPRQPARGRLAGRLRAGPPAREATRSCSAWPGPRHRRRSTPSQQGRRRSSSRGGGCRTRPATTSAAPPTPGRSPGPCWSPSTQRH